MYERSKKTATKLTNYLTGELSNRVKLTKSR